MRLAKQEVDIVKQHGEVFVRRVRDCHSGRSSERHRDEAIETPAFGVGEQCALERNAAAKGDPKEISQWRRYGRVYRAIPIHIDLEFMQHLWAPVIDRHPDPADRAASLNVQENLGLPCANAIKRMPLRPRILAP